MDLRFTGKLVCSIPVKDHKASAQWYRETLNCEVVFENDDLGMSYMRTPVQKVWLGLSQVFKELAGDWEGTSEDGVKIHESYAIIAGGSVVMKESWFAKGRESWMENFHTSRVKGSDTTTSDVVAKISLGRCCRPSY